MSVDWTPQNYRDNRIQGGFKTGEKDGQFAQSDFVLLKGSTGSDPTVENSVECFVPRLLIYRRLTCYTDITGAALILATNPTTIRIDFFLNNAIVFTKTDLIQGGAGSLEQVIWRSFGTTNSGAPFVDGVIVASTASQGIPPWHLTLEADRCRVSISRSGATPATVNFSLGIFSSTHPT